jgi:membrane protease YdiL (CAAX protease family)
MQKKTLAPFVKSLLLFALVFGVQQIISILTRIYVSHGWLQNVAYLPTQVLFIYASLLFMKKENISFRKQGFLMPDGANMYFSIAILLALVYVLATIFLPGILAVFENLPTFSLSASFFLTIGVVLLSSFATEITFRGYIQTNLKRAYGLLPALLINSIMSTSHMLSLPYYIEAASTNTFYAVPILFAENTFLSMFFLRTKTLLCPITYSASIVILYIITPLRALAAEYIPLVQIATYVFLIPLMQFLVAATANVIAEAKPRIRK